MKQVYRFLIFIIFFPVSTFSQVSLLLNNANSFGGVQFDSHVLFINKVSLNVGQLGITDGTLTGTSLLSTSTAYANIGNKHFSAGAYNHNFYINLTESTHGSELWVTDGTIAGTVMLKDINPGSSNSNPYGSHDGGFPVVNNIMYFSADDGVHGQELWKTDGTSSGTILVKDINPGVGTSNINFLRNTGANFLGDTLYFLADDGVHGQELWRTNGTAAETVMVADITPGNGSSDFSSSFIGLNGVLYFFADDHVHGGEPWRSDGTSAGTFMLKDVNPGILGSSDLVNNGNFNALVFNNKLFFVADSKLLLNSNNPQIYTTDGTVLGTLAISNNNVNQGGLSANLHNNGNDNAVILNGKFYFSVNYDNQSVTSIWSSDGTSQNTTLFKIIYPNPGPGGNVPNPLLTILLPQSSATSETFQHPFQGNKFFFVADDKVHGAQLWISDGTLANTKMLPSNTSGNSIDTSNFGQNFSVFFTEGHVFYTATDGVHGYEAWKSDGTTIGTNAVEDINIGSGSSLPAYFGLANNNTLIFSASDGTNINMYKLNTPEAPLPLQLGGFVAEFNGKEVNLHWNTLQEINTSSFNVQRSEDGKSFSTIGNVAAAGNSSTEKNYYYTDFNIYQSVQNVFYYRLQILDKNGDVTYSKINTITVKNLSFKIFPNPFSDNLIVNFDRSSKGLVSIQLLNASGQLIFKKTGNNLEGRSLNLPLKNLASGTYFLTVKIGSTDFKETIIKN